MAVPERRGRQNGGIAVPEWQDDGIAGQQDGGVPPAKKTLGTE